MTDVEVLVRLLAPDPWSFTVFDTLNRKFRLEEIVGIERIKTWRLVFDSTAAGAVESTEAILRETVLMANPNRDVRQVRTGCEVPVKPEIWRMKDGVAEAWVVKVRDLVDRAGEDVARIARSRLGISGLAGVSFATAWVVEMSDRGDRSREIAEQVAVLKRRGKGLLANPHCQEAEVESAAGYLLGGRE
jgi:hypothetical protein